MIPTSSNISEDLPDDESQANDKSDGTSKRTILQLLDERRVVFASPPPEPVTVFSIKGQSICTGGNITVISAQAKAGKTAALSAMIAATLAPDDGRDCLGFESVPLEGRTVLVFDTEQSPYDAWTIQSRVLGRAGLSAQPPQFHHFYLLDLSTKERLEAVIEGTRRAAAEGPILAVFIDGAADLLDDVNDQAEANGLVCTLVKLAVEISAPIITVLHENPGGSGGNGTKTRGHLGSQLERKAESNLRIIKDADGVSTIFSEKCRRASIPQRAGPRFEWDDEMKMHVGREPLGPEGDKPATSGKTVDDLMDLVPFPTSIHKSLLQDRAKAAGINEKVFRQLLAIALDAEVLFEVKVKRPTSRPAIHISRHQELLGKEDAA